MLDLNPGIHLQKEELARIVQQEFDRSGADIVDRFGRRHRRLSHRRTQVFVDGGARALLQHLLVAALNRALTLAEVNRIAMTIGQDLNLNVATAGQ